VFYNIYKLYVIKKKIIRDTSVRCKAKHLWGLEYYRNMFKMSEYGVVDAEEANGDTAKNKFENKK